MKVVKVPFLISSKKYFWVECQNLKFKSWTDYSDCSNGMGWGCHTATDNSNSAGHNSANHIPGKKLIIVFCCHDFLDFAVRKVFPSKKLNSSI